MKLLALLLPVSAGLMLSGCVVATAAAIVAIPIKVAGKAVATGIDAATTTQKEADEDRGRADRKAEEKAEEKAEKDRKKANKEAEKRREQAEKDAERAREKARDPS